MLYKRGFELTLEIQAKEEMCPEFFCETVSVWKSISRPSSKSSNAFLKLNICSSTMHQGSVTAKGKWPDFWAKREKTWKERVQNRAKETWRQQIDGQFGEQALHKSWSCFPCVKRLWRRHHVKCRGSQHCHFKAVSKIRRPPPWAAVPCGKAIKSKGGWPCSGVKSHPRGGRKKKVRGGWTLLDKEATGWWERWQWWRHQKWRLQPLPHMATMIVAMGGPPQGEWSSGQSEILAIKLRGCRITSCLNEKFSPRFEGCSCRILQVHNRYMLTASEPCRKIFLAKQLYASCRTAGSNKATDCRSSAEGNWARFGGHTAARKIRAKRIQVPAKLNMICNRYAAWSQVIQICGRLVWPTSNKNALSMSNRNSVYKKGTKCAAVAGKRFHQNQLRGASSVYRHKTSTPRHTQKAISKKSSGDLLTNRHWGFIRAWISGILVVLICFDCCKRHWLQKMSSLVQHKRIQTLEIISF